MSYFSEILKPVAKNCSVINFEDASDLCYYPTQQNNPLSMVEAISLMLPTAGESDYFFLLFHPKGKC